jgi:hypothetical protein
MIIDWTKHLKDPDEKARFENSVRSAKTVLERLQELVQERLEAVEVSELSIKDFDKPNWAEKQAFKNGFKSFANVVLKLINLDQQKE